MPENYTYHIACSGLAASGAVSSAISSVTAGICKVKMLSKGWTRVAMVAAGGLSGGVASSMADGDFLDGLCNGLISSGLNHAMHLACAAGENAVKKARASSVQPDDPPKAKKTQDAKQNSQNSPVSKETQNVADGATYTGAGLTAVDGGLAVAGAGEKLSTKILLKGGGGVCVFVSEIPDMITFADDPNLGNGLKLGIGLGLGAVTVLTGPVVATAAFVLGVANSCGAFDKYYDKLNP